ncbi:O-antigen ligase family protein [Candidatus Uhrbacteria bacterium]|nr:O-antigen ligase family protein [Candidatus Uhrbacteria bacterium]
MNQWIQRHRFANVLTYAAIFLLPWQTRWIFGRLTLGGEVWEYGTLSLYAVECLVLAACLLRGPFCFPKETLPVRRRIFVLAGAAVVSAFLSLSPLLSWSALFHLVVAILLLGLLLDERLSIQSAAWTFVAGLVAPAMLGLYQVVSGFSPPSTWFGLAEHAAATPGVSVIETAGDRVLRAYGSFSHPNAFGGFLAVGLLGLAFLFPQLKGKKRAVALVLGGLLACASVLTFSRSAWIAAAAGLAMLTANRWRKNRTDVRRSLLFFLVIAVVAISTVTVFHSAFVTRFDADARLEEKSLSERQSEYPLVDDVLRLSPVTGVGIGAYTIALERLSPGQPVWTYQPLHNSFLLYVAETGAVGLVALIGFYVFMFRRTAARQKNGVGLRWAIISVFFVLALLDHYLWTSWSGLGLVAVGLALWARADEVDRER